MQRSLKYSRPMGSVCDVIFAMFARVAASAVRLQSKITSSRALSHSQQQRTMDRFRLAKKYHGLEKNVWVEFVQIAINEKPLNLGQGLPDDLVPDYVIKGLSDVSQADSPLCLHQYTRGFGHPRLVAALSTMYSGILHEPIDAQKEILVTDGAYEALFCCIMGNVDDGDEVIIIEPYYDCYEPMVRLAGGVPRFISLAPPASKKGQVMSSADWQLDPKQLEALFNEKTKAIIINNPNNPLGKVYSAAELELIANLCKKHNVLVISDDVYEHMMFDGSEMIRIASLPDMWQRTITIGSAGKTFSVTGWKLGWAIGPNHLLANCQVVHQNCVYTCPTPIQEAVARCFELELSRLDSPDCYFHSIRAELQRKRDFIAQALRDVGLNPVIPQGGYFIMADWSSVAAGIDLSEEKDQQRDYRFVKWLSKKHKLLGIPPSAFFCDEHKAIGEDYIRLCFIKHDDSLAKAKDILSAWRRQV